MNDEQNVPPSQPSEGQPAAPAAAAAESKPAPPAKKEAPPPEPPKPGVFCQRLSALGITTTPLGDDAMGIEMIDVAAKDLLRVAELLRGDEQMQMDLLVSVSGVDMKDYRQSVYHLVSTKTHKSLAIKVKAEDEKVPSVVSIWPGADWHERESYDLFGIIYEGHPDLRRILMPIDWVGHPMRKDYVNSDPRLVWNER